MEVSEDFELIGQPFALAVATFGLPSDTLVKVRRRHSPEDATGGGKLAIPSETGSSNGAFSDGGGGGGSGGGGSNETCALDSGDEESNGAGWAGRPNGGKVGSSSLPRLGGSSSPFALRRRTYQLLENEDGEERAVRNAGLVKGSSVEMTTLRTERVAKAAWEAGLPTKTLKGGARYAGVVDDVHHDVSPEASCVRAGDVLVLSAARDAMVYAQGSLFSAGRGGLRVLGVSTLRPPQPRSVFFELVLSRSSQFLGRTARLDSDFFAARYGCSVVGFRLKGATSTGGSVDAGDSSGRSNGGADDGGIGETVSTGGGPLSTLAACGSPKAAAAAAAGAAVGTAADNPDGRLFFMGEGDSPAADGGGNSLDATAPTPLLSSFVGDGSPTALPVSPRPAGPGLDSRQRHWRRRRRRRGEAFEAGDVVMVLAAEPFSERHWSTEFLRKKIVGRLPEAAGWFQCVPLAIFVLMLLWVLLGEVEMVRRIAPVW